MTCGRGLHGEHKTIWYSTIRGDVTTSGKSENLLVAMNRFENLAALPTAIRTTA